MREQGIHNLKPWTDLVKLHPDVEDGKLTEAAIAIDLGMIASGDKNVPAIPRARGFLMNGLESRGTAKASWRSG